MKTTSTSCLKVLAALVLASPSLFAQFSPIHHPGPPAPTAEQLLEQQKQRAERKQRAEAKYKQRLERATEAGKLVKLRILTESPTVIAPANTKEQLEAWEDGYRRFQVWLRKWDELERQAWKTSGQDRTQAPRFSAKRGTWVSEQEAVEQLGRRPEIPPKPEHVLEPEIVLEFENTSDESRRIYPSDVYQSIGHTYRETFRGDGLTMPTGISIGASGSGGECEVHFGYTENVCHDGQSRYIFRQGYEPLPEFVDLNPGDTYRLRMNHPDHRFPVYFMKAGTFLLEVEFTSGVDRGPWREMGHPPLLSDDAMVIQAEPLEFTIEFE